MSLLAGGNGVPIAGETASTVAARLIRDAILNGELSPDAPLREAELARQMGISRTPVREALRLLHNDGLVEFTPNRGATVRSYTAADLDDVYNLRAVLEGYAAQLAATHITPEQVSALQESCDRYAELSIREEDLPALADENVRFHKIILDAARSERLAAMVRQVTALPLIYKSYLTFASQNHRSAVRAHRAIAAALAQGSADEARQLVEDHIRWARDQAIDHLPTLGASGQSAADGAGR